MKRRPGTREWLATALCVACAASMVVRLYGGGDASVPDDLARLRAERDALREFNDVRLDVLRTRSTGSKSLWIGPAWQRESKAGHTTARRSSLNPDAWPAVLADLRSWSAAGRVLRVHLRACGSVWGVEAALDDSAVSARR